MLRRLLVFVGAVLCTAPLYGAVCYNPEARGLRVSRYQLDTLASPYLSHPMDFSADPWAVAGSEAIDFSQPAIFAAYERRYGPGTACTGGLASRPECGGHVFKRFAGPGNEVRSLVADALAWWAATSPQALGGGPGCHSDGRPSEREITDVQALSDAPIWMEFHRQALPGGNPNLAIDVCRKGMDPVPFTETDPFWGWTNHYRNTCGAPPATGIAPTPASPSPPVAPPPAAPPAVTCEAPPAEVLAAARRVRTFSTAKAAGQRVIDWLDGQAKRCHP